MSTKKSSTRTNVLFIVGGVVVPLVRLLPDRRPQQR